MRVGEPIKKTPSLVQTGIAIFSQVTNSISFSKIFISSQDIMRKIYECDSKQMFHRVVSK